MIGEREVAQDTVTLRRHGSRDQEQMSFGEFRERLRQAIRTRARAL